MYVCVCVCVCRLYCSVLLATGDPEDVATVSLIRYRAHTSVSRGHVIRYRVQISLYKAQIYTFCKVGIISYMAQDACITLEHIISI